MQACHLSDARPVVLLIFALAGTVSLSLAAQSTSGRASSAPAPAVAFADIDWLAGRWHLADESGTWDEVWLPPVGDCMSGTLRWVRDGKVALYELLSIERSVETEAAEDGVGNAEPAPAFTMLIRHFNKGLVPWASEAEGPTRLPLKSATDAVQVWEGRSDHGVRITYTRTADSTMNVRVETEEAEGGWQQRVSLDFTRAE